MATKLSLFNAALSATGNNQVAENDGTDEWVVLDSNYPSIVKCAFEEVEPNFGRVLRHPLTSRIDGVDQRYPDGWRLPTDLLVLQDVYVSDNFWTDWITDADHLYVDASSAVEIDYIRQGSEPQWSGAFERAVQMMLEAVCLRGLNEEYSEAEARDRAAFEQLVRAGAKSSQQRSPQKVYQRSRLMTARFSGRRRLLRHGES